eukprot:CAMPEP_0116055200 /NCGR_PEP_ID=MMETSP0322-20121206/3259_1 /TAXON_ID=163516 /ORGANISM="Leptocylindrus danicus var. apora, Strain B651" /LENGTH=178 /DNA_ID=CAMNT_0003538745 /DNA_START=43 /DNA_END=579 /DNA_ORIENTATION=+
MKTVFATIALFAVANAYTAPFMATRAVKKAAPAAPKKSGPPASKGYPSFDTSGFKIKGISGGGNKAPPAPLAVPDFSDPAKQIERDPEFYAAAALTRLAKKQEFVYEDGLTELERKQRVTIPGFLTGSAKSQIDSTSIRSDIEPVDYFGLSADRFQLLFISVFGLFTLVGCLSGNLKL